MYEGWNDSEMSRSARNYAVLSMCGAVITIVLKMAAYFMTGSVGLFSDAAETLVNLVAAIVAFWALTVAAKPADSGHTYGYSKVEYFSSALESTLILLAAGAIAMAAWDRLWHPQVLVNTLPGIVSSLAAAGVNAWIAFVLLRASRRLTSITLRADSAHLFTDVCTSLGVVAGVILVSATGWLFLDPLVAFLVAANIVRTGTHLLRDTARGLSDSALPAKDVDAINSVFKKYRASGIEFHALRTRGAGSRRFMSTHVLVPDDWSVARGHALCEQLEADLRAVLPGTTVFTHLEPISDPASWIDIGLDRTNAYDQATITLPDHARKLREEAGAAGKGSLAWASVRRDDPARSR